MYCSTDLSIILGSTNKYYLKYLYEAKHEKVIDFVPCHHNMVQSECAVREQPKWGRGWLPDYSSPKSSKTKIKKKLIL
jgi:hypothetical protein